MLFLDGTKQCKNMTGKLLLKVGTCQAPPVRNAIRLGLTNVLEILFSTSYNVNYRDEDGITALHWACYNFPVAEWLLELTKENDTIDLTARDTVGKTAFHLACQEGRTEIAKMILDLSKENDAIDLNARINNVGWTPFLSACREGNTEIVKLIIGNVQP